MNPIEIINHFYPEDTPLRRLLLKHSRQVCEKALEIMQNPVCRKLELDPRLVADGAMLHDIGIGFCHAPGILCEGDAPYIAHGVIGAKMLREYRAGLEPYARICERHTGVGITAKEVAAQGLPIPQRDYLPETPEEKLIALADKFYSKSGNMQEKSVSAIRRSLSKFGDDSVARFDALCRLFGVAE
ncbi:MAG: HD domain-containing protein [Victivallaceae bacterium]|nr:HD domain-containing protein [Victivallaceae bacterium]